MLPETLGVLLIALAQVAPPAAPPADTSAAAVPVAADLQHGEVLYRRHCAACHGTRAWGDGPREIPALAGQREAYLIEQLTRFASDLRPGSAMHGPAMHDALKATDVNRPVAIRDLAAYLARTPASPQAEPGPGRALAAGRNAYLRACAGCHGENGAGTDWSAPRIGGQHFRYLLARLREFGATHRGLVEPAALSAQEQQALADYISRLPAGGGTP
ncbi:MAG TPA: c-type cytochrome [Candidatus Dormibacteraeota bacterium]|nr:c-type cytochrome [Candidatus Dormibacteraeota bacterium]